MERQQPAGASGANQPAGADGGRRSQSEWESLYNCLMGEAARALLWLPVGADEDAENQAPASSASATA